MTNRERLIKDVVRVRALLNEAHANSLLGRAVRRFKIPLLRRHPGGASSHTTATPKTVRCRSTRHARRQGLCGEAEALRSDG
jgi:hypothetical protein